MNDEEALEYARTRDAWKRFNKEHFTRVYVEAYRDGKEGFNGAKFREEEVTGQASSERGNP